MAAFSQFASDLDAATQRLLARGSRLTELLKQPQFAPVPVEEQVMAIFAGTRGYLDTIQVSDVGRFESSMLGEIRSKRPELLEAIRTAGEITPEVEKALEEFLDGFVRTFA
jgi:F-type H+/Na+-transporting ATPase subunit alpha